MIYCLFGHLQRAFTPLNAHSLSPYLSLFAAVNLWECFVTLIHLEGIPGGVTSSHLLPQQFTPPSILQASIFHFLSPSNRLALNHSPPILTIRFNVHCPCSCASQSTSCSPAGHINPCDRCLSGCSLLGNNPERKESFTAHISTRERENVSKYEIREHHKLSFFANKTRTS